jgi:CheY-like chemotaxis protein
VREHPNLEVRRHRGQQNCGLTAPHRGLASAQTLVWIDDYEPALSLYKLWCESSGFRVLTATTGQAGIELVSKNKVAGVITDYEMPGMNGVAVANSIKRMRPDLPVIMFSGNPAVSAQVKDVVDAFCDKAGSRQELLAVIHKLIGNQPNGTRVASQAELGAGPSRLSV